MKDTLKTLQGLQARAFEKGIHSFQINARRYEDEDVNCQSLVVTVILRDIDDDEGYGTFYFYGDSPAIENLRALNNLKAFVGEG